MVKEEIKESKLQSKPSKINSIPQMKPPRLNPNDFAQLQQSYINSMSYIKPPEIDTESFELIKKLSLENELAFQQPAMENCPICLSEMVLSDSIYNEKCPHMFHKECMFKYIFNCIETRKIPIKCPFSKCGSEITVKDIENYGKELKDTYEQLAFKILIENNPKDYSCCPTPDCQYVFLYSEGKDQPKFGCPLCGHLYCLNCHCEYHEGMSCKEYKVNNTFSKEDQQFNDFVKGQKFKQCPKCKFWVEKNQGCNHMTCRCTMQFCYVCGGNYPNCNCVK